MQISAKVQRVLVEEGISGQELDYMITHAANCRLDGCNLRYFHWLMKSVGNVLVNMRYVDHVEIGEGTATVMEEHDECKGEGCRDCGWVGNIVRRIEDATAIGLEQPSFR